MLALLIALSAQAQAQARAPALNPRLEPLSFVLGSCWRGRFGDGRTDTHCFTPIYGGAFVRDRHVVEGNAQAYRGETLYRWDSAAERIRYDYYASDGAHSAGAAEATATGVAFEDVYRDAAGEAGDLRVSWTRDGSDAYLVRARLRQGVGWRELFQIKMTRAGPAPAD
jgi:hypothetical protein